MNHIEVMKQALDEMRRLARLANVVASVDHYENPGVVALEQAIKQAEQAQPSDGGHSAAQCDEATCPLCEQHYPEIAAAARQAAKLAKPVVSIDTSQERVEKPHANEHEQAQPVACVPSHDQLKQIIENLNRCHVFDSKAEFLRVWIRDWTAHKLRTAPPQRQPLTLQELQDMWNAQADEHNKWSTLGHDEIVAFTQAAHGIKENT